MAVAIVGYRTYPDADVDGQVNDLEQAAEFLIQHYPALCGATRKLPIGTCVMGHSSGAHIALLMIVDRAIRKRQAWSQTTTTMNIDSFLGVSGPYSICHHFDFEAARGVEEFSPMKAACGHSRDSFRKNSPALRLMDNGFLDINERDLPTIQACLPCMALVHGIEDDTVPFTATAEAARVLRSCGVTQCHEIYLAEVGHQQAITQIMFGGPTRDAVVEWLKGFLSGTETSTNKLVYHSKL
jgi:acetyl esterase/lipase